MSEGPLPNSWREAIPVVTWVVLVLAFGLLFVDSLGQLFTDPLGRAAFAFASMVGLVAMLIYRKWLLERFKALSGDSVLAVIIILLLVLTLTPFVYEGRWPTLPPMTVIVATVGIVIVILITMTRLIWRRPQNASIEPLAAGLYVGEICLGLDLLKADRHVEVQMRVFNGTGSVIEIANMSGEIQVDLRTIGTKSLPPPSISSNTNQKTLASREWIITLAQRVPQELADKIADSIAGDQVVSLYFGSLNIQVCRPDHANETERIPLWDGVTVQKGLRFGRVVQIVGRATL
jgi:hypothetical protein